MAHLLAPTQSLARTASWVIKEKTTGRVVLETFSQYIASRVAPGYVAVPILEHLQSLNASLKEAK